MAGSRGPLDSTKAFLVVSRVEYMPSAINEVGIPACLALLSVPPSSRFVALTFQGLIVWWLAHCIGAQINCLADYEVDQKHKSRLPKAVDVLGKRTLGWVVVVETIATTGIVLFLTVQRERPLLSVFWSVGLAFTIGYSVLPLRLKGRRLWNPFTLALVLYVCPMLFVYHLISPTFDPFAILVVLLFVAQMVPMFLVDEVSDYEEDKEQGIETPCVFYGRFKITIAALLIYVAATVAMIGAFVPLKQRDGLLTHLLISFSVLSFLLVVSEFCRLAYLSRQFDRAREGDAREVWALRLKEKVRTPVWLMSTGIAVIALVMSVLK